MQCTLLALLLVGILGQVCLPIGAGAYRIRNRTEFFRQQDDDCTSVRHLKNGAPAVTLFHQSAEDYVECPVKVLPRRSRCQFRIEWYRNGEWLNFGQSGTTRQSKFLRWSRRGRKLTLTRVLPTLAGNYTCRIAHSDLYPASPGCQPDSEAASCYPAESLRQLQLIVDLEPHPANAARLALYPPDSPQQLQPGKLYLSRQVQWPQVELAFRGDPQPQAFQCPIMLAHRRSAPPAVAPQVAWFHRPESDSRNVEFSRVVPSSSPGYRFVAPESVPCQPKDFGFAYLSDEFSDSNLTVACYRASLTASVVSDASHGIYRCTASFGNSSINQTFRLGLASKVFLPVVDFNKNSSVCRGGRLELDYLVQLPHSIVVLARVEHPRFDESGAIVNYSSFEKFATYRFPTGLENGSAASASLSVGANDLRLKLLFDSVTADSGGYYVCAVRDFDTGATALRYSRLEVLSECAVGEEASRLSAVASAGHGLNCYVLASSNSTRYDNGIQACNASTTTCFSLTGFHHSDPFFFAGCGDCPETAKQSRCRTCYSDYCNSASAGGLISDGLLAAAAALLLLARVR